MADKNKIQSKSPASPPQVDAVREDALELLKSLHNGDVAFELSRRLADVVAAVSATGRKAGVRLTLTVSPEPKLGENAMAVEAVVDPIMPKTQAFADYRFATDKGALLKDDPRQMQFRFSKDATAPAAE